MVVAGGALPHSAPQRSSLTSATFWTTAMATKPPPATFEPPDVSHMPIFNIAIWVIYAYCNIDTVGKTQA